MAYSITIVYRYSSQDAHGTDWPVLIWYAVHWLFKHALATQAASDLRLCLRLFFSQASTYVHVNLRWGNHSPLSPSMQRSAVKTKAHTSVPGATLLGAVLILYTVNRLLQQTLLHKPRTVLRLCLRLPFLFFLFFLFLFFSFSLLVSRGLPPRMHIKLPWGHLSMAVGLAEGNIIKYNTLKQEDFWTASRFSQKWTNIWKSLQLTTIQADRLVHLKRNRELLLPYSKCLYKLDPDLLKTYLRVVNGRSHSDP